MNRNYLKIYIAVLVVFSIVTCQFNKSPKLLGFFSLLSITNNNSYTVGGAVSGLSGTIVLQNNGADNLSLTADGNFTFVTGLANNSTYSVTVFTQPSNKNCIVSNGTGTINLASVSNVAITCTGNANGLLSNGTIINTLTLTGGVSTFAGFPCAVNDISCTPVSNGFVNSATPANVRFNGAEGMTTDGFFLYVADKGNQRIRKVSLATGETTTLAGNGTQGILDGTGTSAGFDNPNNLVTDGVNIYVTDKNNKAIRKIDINTGVVTTIISGSASLSDPKGLAIYNNKLYVGDNGTNSLHQIDLSTNVLTTVISSGLNDPTSIALVGTDLYITDKNTDTIKKTTIGTWTLSTFAGTGVQGLVDGTGTISAQFRNPEDITTDGVNLYVSDTGNHALRKIVIATAVVTTLAGTTTNDYINSATSSSARFDRPRGIVSDGAKLYVLDKNNETIRVIQ